MQLASLQGVLEGELTGSREPGEGGGCAWPTLDLEGVPGLPCLPTLNGWLLGYPIVYLVEDAAQACLAGRVLSASSLDLFRVKAAPAAPAAAGSDAAGARGTRRDLLADAEPVDLLAFTLPSELRDAGVDVAVDGFVAELVRRQAGAAGEPWWGELRLHVERMGPRPVAL